MRLAMVLLAGCGRVAFDPNGDASDAPDGSEVDAPPPQCMTFSAFGPAAPMTVLNSSMAETSPSLTNDGLSIYFGSYVDGDQDIYVSRRAAIGAPWGTPTKVVELELVGNEEGNVEISGDELELFYGEYAVYHSTRGSVSDPWPPVTLMIGDSSPFTSPQGPELSRDGLTLHFYANVAGMGGDMFYTTRADRAAPFIGAQSLSALNTTDGEGFVSLSAIGVEMFFTNYANGPNVYRATRPDTSTHATWVSGGVLADIDTGSDQEDAEISADGTELYFLSTRAGGLGVYDIWLATRVCLD